MLRMFWRYRASDRMKSLKVEVEGVMLNVISGYGPQV